MPPKARAASRISPAKPAAPRKVDIVAAVSGAKAAMSANQRRAEQLLDLVTRRLSRMAEDFYEVGKALKELLEKKLYVALEYPSFEAMIQARARMSTTQAFKLIEVVRRVPLETAIELGVEKAFALARYAAATPDLDTPQLLVERGAKIGETPLLQASRREIDDATKKLRKAAAARKGKVDAAEREAAAVARRGITWLKARGAKKAQVKATRTRGAYLVTVTFTLAEATALFAS